MSFLSATPEPDDVAKVSSVSKYFNCNRRHREAMPKMTVIFVVTFPASLIVGSSHNSLSARLFAQRNGLMLRGHHYRLPYFGGGFAMFR